MVDELKDDVGVVENETGIYEELLGDENDVFKFAEYELVDEGCVGEYGNSILGCKGCLGINGSVEWRVVEIIDDIMVSKWEIEGLDVYANNSANSIASFISLRIVAFISSILSWALNIFDSKFAKIFFYFVSRNEIKKGSITTLFKLVSNFLLKK